MTITLSFGTTLGAESTVREFIAHEIRMNLGVNGADVAYEYGDYLGVDGIDEIAGTILYHQISDIIDGTK